MCHSLRYSVGCLVSLYFIPSLLKDILSRGCASSALLLFQAIPSAEGSISIHDAMDTMALPDLLDRFLECAACTVVTTDSTGEE